MKMKIYLLHPLTQTLTFQENFENENERIIVLGCRELIQGRGVAEIWLADGTFKVVPELFFQLYTIHFQYKSGCNPAALYCLLPKNTQHSYTRMVQNIKTILPNSNPRTILLDFETAAMNAFSNEFPNSEISGCYLT